jgi:hypothetical protein
LFHHVGNGNNLLQREGTPTRIPRLCNKKALVGFQRFSPKSFLALEIFRQKVFFVRKIGAEVFTKETEIFFKLSFSRKSATEDD